MLAFLNRGGCVVAVGELGKNLPAEVHGKLFAHPLLLRTTELHASAFANGPQVTMKGAPDMAINLQRVDSGCAVHLVRYDYDEDRDEVPVLPLLDIDIRVQGDFRMAKVFSPTGEVELTDTTKNGVHHLQLRNVPVYCVVLLQGKN
ncbi:MAG: hypothetical protein EHM70_11830 [Chloroflexota bacterium]|nr:MAG: hypothetical protein EHM70_11830 [Chloroflexota bacterium]